MLPIQLCHLQGPITPSEHRISSTMIGLKTLEIWQHIGVAPPGVPPFQPAIEVASLAPVENVAIDSTRAPNYFAARLGNPTTASPFSGFCLIQPVDSRIVNRFHKSCRNVDVGIAVHWTCFENTDLVIPIACQATCYYAAGTACADNDVVKGLCQHGNCYSFRLGW
ncbi:hypothetical protein MGWOODY_XGa1153 [hydrothermal vent metagenome]|uniref:Uncharacterized protein n=1 Tax=hydrothermal vent metagenome TaxID=652676 RepID=A0A160TSN5_9ZZZZ